MSVGRAVAALLGLSLVACAPVRSSADPFADAGSAERPSADARPYRVRLEVTTATHASPRRYGSWRAAGSTAFGSM